ncbi:hypothetical protein EV645_5724 [Kribbella rubisoli]|uniref:Uncharacterized protein n=1 Tax=Kribbella rubisoli TaxID=3075929 RepID=A0A4Q7WQD0_9ACTN|nr:hypothetical protein [Kribbella rubisoli]RZU12454.1 hypothetical protein EV645_5724 [Kribbella rubisoli]
MSNTLIDGNHPTEDPTTRRWMPWNEWLARYEQGPNGSDQWSGSGSLRLSGPRRVTSDHDTE